MAVANLHRLRQIHRLPAITYSKTIFSRWSASATTSLEHSSSSSKKVSDRTIKLFAYDLEGTKKEIVGLTGQTLLKALANRGLIDPDSHRLEQIDACSAECEVRIAQDWINKLPPRSYDEEYVLKRNSRARTLNKNSRLGCQVILTPDLEGMVVVVPEPKPWDIP
ncbi:uncharacterized protein LOC101218877 [Cucumis sativus]|uniref:2Fe-2S ferredoxin-type domain-containing protein n=1 Tax=Cucumis sativus TaxID=3659 RepID=A0A0A0K8M3_CUCSA|nr:uncharacterized protein LOC101218877 [Cucumis sativus]